MIRFKAYEIAVLVRHLNYHQGESPRGLCGESELGAYLVGDQGVYLMPNVGYVPRRSYVVFAEGCNPKTDPDYYERKRELFGGDDGAEFVPIEILKGFMESKRPYLDIELTDETVAFSFECEA